MADEPEKPGRGGRPAGEAALERIAVLATIPPVHPETPTIQSDADLSIPEIAERLDGLIARLRAALDDSAQSD